MIDETLLEAEEKMEKAVEVAKEDFAGIRTGRAHPGMFAKILVDYYGSPTPLQQLASFQTPEARTIVIAPFDKGSMQGIERAIRDADLGVNPSKMARHQAEDARVSIRNIRRHAKDAIERLVKDGDVGEDEGTRGEKDLEAMTKKNVEGVDDLLKHKEAELLEV